MVQNWLTVRKLIKKNPFLLTSVIYHLIPSYSFASSKPSYSFFFFHSNGFPLKLVEPQNHKFLLNIMSLTFLNPIKGRNFVPLYLTQSDRFAKKLCVLLSKFVPQYDFVLVRVNRHKIGSLINYKSRPFTSF